MLAVGTKLREYTILSLIGKGGMSKVWLAEDDSVQKKWAIKEIVKTTPEFITTVRSDGKLDEIEMLKKIDSPYTPRIVDLLEDVSTLYVVMDYISGENLQKMLQREKKIKPDLVAKWMVSVCSLLSYLHKKGIIYRDIKPANIILTEEGNIKIIDFGIAKEVINGRYDDQVVIGTKGYTAPEHLNHRTDEKTDQYSVGVTMYQLITGENPSAEGFSIKHLKQINKRYSTGLDEIIQKSTDPNPNKRFKDMDEMIVALENYKKLDSNYFHKIKRRVRTHNFIHTLGALAIIAGICCFIYAHILDLSVYKQLINKSELNPEALQDDYIQAIEIRPYDSQAYSLLIDLLNEGKGGLTESEAQEIEQLFAYYDSHAIIKASGYGEVCHKIGDAYLLYYESIPISKVRERLDLASAYYERSAQSKYEMSEIASSLVFMNDFTNARMNKEELTQVGANEFFTQVYTLINASSTYFGKGTTKLKLVIGNVIAYELKTSKSDFLKAGISQSSYDKLIERIEQMVDVTTSNSVDEAYRSYALSLLGGV